MKFFHISDIHLGKRFKGVSFINDQKYILNQITEQIKIHNPNCIVIAGDIYDKSIPPTEAVELLDSFLTNLAQTGIYVLIISGNHDSAERLQFAGNLLEKNNIYIASVFDGSMKKVTVKDSYGDFDFYLLPFFRQSQVKSIFKDCEINSNTEALKAIIDNTKINHDNRNTIVLHQFAAPSAQSISFSDSETQSAGGLDIISTQLLKDFDYAALGHIHKPQNMGTKIRYCGTPLKYSFSEASQEKSITVVEINKKNETHIDLIPLNPLHEMRIVKGPFEKLLEAAEKEPSDDYIDAVITDNEILSDPIGKLRQYYPNLLQLEFSKRDRKIKTHYSENFISKSTFELFSDFFMMQNGREFSPEQKKIVEELLKEENYETD
ncbi:exonuclease SbcCD subunit D [Porcipelethomonas sp.]|uniref:exonuclease SbcCD subunit D n=1 Tax=Porcipelethomonas sp. TaxID=2981675 RepID=UPI003EF63620